MTSTLPGLFASLTHGVYVIGVGSESCRNAFTAAWVMQTSFDPPMLAISINPHHSSYQLLVDQRAFSVNVLRRNQLNLAEHFAQPARVDKLATMPWRPGITQVPILDAALAWLECRVEKELPAGDHVIVTGLVIAGARQGDNDEPLIYRDTGALDGSAALYPTELPPS